MKSQLGVLLLNGKTFGSYKNRMLYRCLPANKDQKPLIIPYNIKWGFSKNVKNKYISFVENGEIPGQGILQNLIGDVDDLNAWNEYELLVRGFAKKNPVAKKIEKMALIRPPDDDDDDVVDRSNEFVFTIDNKNTIDYDDAFSLQKTSETGHRLSIYITDVASWVRANEGLRAALLECRQPATLYLPHSRIPFLSPEFVDSELTLKATAKRTCLALDVFIENGEIVDAKWTPRARIIIGRNYSYLDRDSILDEFMELSLTTATTSTTTEKTFDDSIHDAVAFWMEFYNTHAGITLWSKKRGLFLDRRTWRKNIHQFTDPKFWTPSQGYYFYSQTQDPTVTPYCQMTSPIRRWVDIYNQYSIMFDDCDSLCHRIPLEIINKQMKHVRKLQMDSALMHHFFEQTTTINKNIYTATIIDLHLTQQNRDKKYKYTVYIEELKMLSRLTTLYPLNEKDKIKVGIYLFKDEYSLKQKIKLCQLSL
jgi:hypothetical protein